MIELERAVLKHGPGLPPELVATHLRRMPESYAERHSPAEIARHLKLVARLDVGRPVEVGVRPLGGDGLEVLVVGDDRTGVLAAITSSLAADGLDVHDLQIATYLPPEGPDVGPARFVDVARVAGGKGRSLTELAEALRERLTEAFGRLAAGDLRGAQSAASDSKLSRSSAGLGARAAPAAIGPGARLGDFVLEARIASGGMAEVYRAGQPSLGRKVAIKLMASPAGIASDRIARFEREAAALASFNSPRIVPVFASGTAPAADGSLLRWLALEYLPNGDLAAYFRRRGRPPVALGVRWFLQALEGLLYAHRRGVLHRDVKPHNLLLTADRDVKLGDFGLMKADPGPEPDANLTVAGVVMGTPQYISPEQALGEEADERSDIYSLGVTFFHLMTGRATFEEKVTTALLLKVARDDPPRALAVAPDFPRPLAIVLDRMIARRREDRYQDARVVLDDLQSYIRRGLLPPTDDPLPDDGPAPDERSLDLTEVIPAPGLDGPAS